MIDYRDEYRKEWNAELRNKQMEKCRVCGCELIEDNNYTYEDGICDECFEDQCDDELSEEDEEDEE